MPTDTPTVTPARRSAGCVVVRGPPAAREVLLLRAWRNWDFPKGLIEGGETPLQAALRETREEAGLAELSLPWGDGSVDTEPYARGKVATFFAVRLDGGVVTLPVNAALGRPEHHEFRWLPFDAARPLLVPRLQRVLDWARGRADGR